MIEILALLQWTEMFQGQSPTCLHTSLLGCHQEVVCKHTHRRTHRVCSLVAQSPSRTLHLRKSVNWLQVVRYPLFALFLFFMIKKCSPQVTPLQALHTLCLFEMSFRLHWLKKKFTVNFINVPVNIFAHG